MPAWLAEVLQNATVLALVGIIGRLIWREIQIVRKEHEDHVAICNEIPKRLIMEKLESLSDKQDEHHQAATERLQEVKNNLYEYHKRTGAVERDIVDLKTDVRWLKATTRADA